MTRTLRAGIAGVLISLVATGSSVAATVSVRVEGKSSTLLPRTAVTLPGTASSGGTCSQPGTMLDALELGTKGDWDHAQYVNTILGETRDYNADSSYWALWVFRAGRYVVANGGCSEMLGAGEEALFAYQQAPAPNYASTFFPTWIAGLPATVKPGEPVTVTVNRAACETASCNPGEGHAMPQAGATVSGASAPATTDVAGHATIRFSDRGPASLRATAASVNPTATEAVCVSDGADGYCGTTAAPGTAPPPPEQAGSAPARVTAPDRSAPEGRITGIREQQRFSRRHAPRKLAGSVSDPSGIHQVKLSLTRQVGRRCWVFSGKRERFRRSRCGHHPRFAVGDRGEVSYLLPKRLAKGRYVLDFLAVDRAFNRDTPARGRNRVVFYVR